MASASIRMPDPHDDYYRQSSSLLPSLSIFETKLKEELASARCCIGVYNSSTSRASQLASSNCRGHTVRICLYTETALPVVGGQEMVVDALARQFISQGHEPVVLAPPARRLAMADRDFPYLVLRHPRFVSTRHFMDWYKNWLVRAHRRHRFDVLHCHSIYPCGYLAALCKDRLGVPTVITSHGGDVHVEGRRLQKPGLPARYAQSISAADALIAISRFTYDGYLRLCPTARNIVSIPNGVHLEPFANPVARPAGLDPAVRAGKYFLFIGRLHPRKGVDILLEAMSQLPAEHHAMLVIAGDGIERESLEKLCAQRGLGAHVRFVGAAQGTAKSWLLTNAQFVVTPSRTWEAFGLVVLEAYAAGRPVIATTLPGMQELVEPGGTGLLIPPESTDALAAAIGAMLANPSMTEQFGERARQVAQDYSWRSIAERHLELFDYLRGTGRQRRAA